MAVKFGPMTQQQVFNKALKNFTVAKDGKRFMEDISKIPEDKLIKMTEETSKNTDGKFKGDILETIKMLPDIVKRSLEQKALSLKAKGKAVKTVIPVRKASKEDHIYSEIAGKLFKK